jgi:hypothetical protein
MAQTGTNRLFAARPQLGPFPSEVAARVQADLVRLETTEDLDGIKRLEAAFLNWGRTENDPPAFRYFDTTFTLGKEIWVKIGDDASRSEIFKGQLTAIHAVFGELRSPELVIKAEDRAIWMRANQPSRLHGGGDGSVTDADMARAAAVDARLGADATVSGPSYDDFAQINQSDLAFLRERARAVDARLAVEDGNLVFRPRAEPRGASVTERRGTILWLDVGADLAHQRTQVRVHGYSVKDKRDFHATVTTSSLAPGKDTGPGFLQGAGVTAIEDLHLETPADEAEARKIAESLARQRVRSFVVARGTTSGTPSLRVGTELVLEELGPWFSGSYLTTEVRHTYDNRVGHRTHFVACRDRLGRRATTGTIARTVTGVR